MYELPLLFQVIIALGAVAAATGAIWQWWGRHAMHALSKALAAAQEIATDLREMREFLTAELPKIIDRLDHGAKRFDEHDRRLNSHDRRFIRVERHVGLVPPDVEPTEDDGTQR